MPKLTILSISQGPYTLAEARSCIPIKDANGKTIASVKYRANDLADAKLFAASWELLASAKGALDVISNIANADGSVNAEARDAAQQLRAAITKAEA